MCEHTLYVVTVNSYPPILQFTSCVESRLCKVYRLSIIACTQQQPSCILLSTQNVSHVTEDEAWL